MTNLTQTSSLEGDTLDRFVALALGWKIVCWGGREVWVQASGEGRFQCNVKDWHPSTNPSQAYTIIEREKIATEAGTYLWIATHFHCTDNRVVTHRKGDTLLIAAMRCFVASIYGEEVDLSL